MREVVETADGLILRDAQPEERAAIRGLTLQAYAPYAQIMDSEAWAGLENALHTALAMEEPGIERIVAERAGKLIGSVMLYPRAADAYNGVAEGQANWPEVRLLAVAPEAQGQGIGQALMDECVRRAREAGASDLGLHTSVSMQAALRLYERMGFVRAPEHDFRPPGAELVQAYRLPLR